MSSEDSPKLRMPVTERDHVQGPPDAAVTLLEYGDYQCPYCGEAYPIIKKVQETFPNDLRFVFRNFPLTNVHPFAEIGAEIAEAAGAQGKFWEMHDFIYEHQQHLATHQYFVKYAGEELGLDSAKMSEAVSNHTYLPRIKEDFMSGVRSGVNGTPTLFINGIRHNGSYEYDVLIAAIEKALKPQPTVSRPQASKRKNPTKKRASSARKVRTQ